MPTPAWKTWSALGIVYVVWGSTYLAIAYVVVDLPPLLSAGARFGVAAALLAGWVLFRRGSRPFAATPGEWARAATIGLFLLLGGNGLVMLAQNKDLPSGLTALVVAAVPLEIVVLRRLTGDRPTARTVTGVAIGFGGLAVLLLPGARPVGVPVVAVSLVLMASALWSVGSFLAGRWVLPKDQHVTTVAEMLGGAAGLVLAGALHGEGFTTAGVGVKALLAWAYLVVFGSVVAFTAYSWLLKNAPLSRVSTYAYVNPVVAVALGTSVAGETVTATTVVGGLVTLVAVAIVVTEQGRRAQSPTDRHGRLRSAAT